MGENNTNEVAGCRPSVTKPERATERECRMLIPGVAKRVTELVRAQTKAGTAFGNQIGNQLAKQGQPGRN